MANNQRPWYQQALSALQQDREVEDGRDSIAARQREQEQRYEAELRKRATITWWANREERQHIREIKRHSPEIRRELAERLIAKRMAVLREKDRQKELKELMADPKQSLRERVGRMVRGEPAR